jgi:hypothetical protein
MRNRLLLAMLGIEWLLLLVSISIDFTCVNSRVSVANLLSFDWSTLERLITSSCVEMELVVILWIV